MNGASKPAIAIINPDARGFYPSTHGTISKGTLFPSPLPPSSSTFHPPVPSPAPFLPLPGSLLVDPSSKALRASRSDVRLGGERDYPSLESLREGDVLGRILGWRDGGLGRRPQSANAVTIGRFAAGGAGWAGRQELPEIFRRGHQRGSSGAVKEEREEEGEEELPEDLVEELAQPEREEVELPFARQRKVSTRSVASSARLSKASVPAAARRSEDSAKSETRVQRPPRFQDPGVFDLFVDASSAGEKRASSKVASSTAVSPTASLSASAASELASSISRGSVASSAVSGRSGDVKFVVWGERPHPVAPSGPASRRKAGRGSGEASAGSSPALGASSPGSPPAPSKRWTRAPKPSSAEHAPQANGSGSPALSLDGSADRRSVGSDAMSATAQKEGRPVVAATLERWIAELTSRIDAGALADFFLTYRSVIRPLDLCHLLIARFEWALRKPEVEAEGEKERGERDKAARRIVRVRTFVVIRHWLLNHFEDDFLRDRELRSCLTSWLNAIAKDPRVALAPDDMRIVKSLKKVVKQRKETFLGYNLAQPVAPAPPPSRASSAAAGEVDGINGKEPLREVKSASTLRGDERPASGELRTSDDDVDLEEIPEGARHASPTGFLASRLSTFAPPRKEAREDSPPVSGLYQSRKSMSQPVGLAAMAAAAATASENASAGAALNRKSTVSAGLPQSHGTLTRAFTSTMGTLSRFRRMLNNRSNAQHHSAATCISPAAFDEMDLQPNETGDLLYVRGGLERYLSFFQLKGDEGSVSSASAPGGSQGSLPSPATTDSLETPGQSGAEEPVVIVDPENPLGISGLEELEPRAVADDVSAEETPTRKQGGKLVHESASKETIRSEVSVPRRHLMKRNDRNVGELLGERDRQQLWDATNPWCLQLSRPTSVQLDDVDLSDASEDEAPAPRKLRRLPAATDLKQALALRPMSFRSSVGTMSSYGTHRVPSMAASMFRRARASTVSMSASESDEAAGMPVVDNFVAEGLESDDDEPGDVEAALRRLEGVIDADRQREKARRVEAQMLKSSKHAARRHGVVISEDGFSDADNEDDSSSVAAPSEASGATPASVPEDPATSEPSQSPPRTAVAGPEPQHVRLAPIPDPGRSHETLHTNSSSSAKGRRLTSRRISRKGSLYKLFGNGSRTSLWPQPSVMLPPVHRSFLLDCRTELLAQQFCLIERDLLRNVSWQELIGGSWSDRSARRDTLSWADFLKDRAREKVQAKSGGLLPPPRDVAAVIARFNLTCNWVASEIVLTSSLDERVVLLGKFIRMAFKCYRQNNFQTVAQIIHGLQTPYVERLKKTWAKLGIWEARMFRDLKAFTSHQRNFKSLRNIQDAIADAYGPPGQAVAPPPAAESRRMSTSAGRPLGLTGCIPFLGLYLRDLTVTDELPTYFDPFEPRIPADVDSATGEVARHSIGSGHDAPDVPLYPLVNVHKLRIVASVLQKVLSFQEGALLFPYEADSSLFLTCLKIKSLDGEQLRRSSLICEP